MGRRTAAPAFALTPAESRPVNQDDATTECEALAKRQPHVFEITPCAVDKDDRRRGFLRFAIRPELDDVLAQAADIDKAAARRMHPLNQPRANESNDGAGGKNFSDDGQRVSQSASPFSQRAPSAYSASRSGPSIPGISVFTL